MSYNPQPLTRCQEGQDKTPPMIVVPPGESVHFHLMLCETPANVWLWLDDTRNQQQAWKATQDAQHTLTQIPPGLHLLFWFYQVPPGQAWQSRTDLYVGNQLVFRHLKSNQSSYPKTDGFIYVMVQ